ncbi:unnamed protein product [Polarella glacialis]|uniref:Uncharacterized protein n=1 Tax=Polarella glacialis TaxID=89957 RepID=A0A813DYQ8_POLGL|nr:unnamed protein product [Polarella glacialis]CAE8606474.1 unnamed protein product [Polarella glacialis]
MAPLDNAKRGSLEEVLACQQQAVPASLGERMMLQAPKPVVSGPLPPCFRANEFLRYDPECYDFRAEAIALLAVAGPKVGFGAFSDSDEPQELEAFKAKPAVFHFKYEKRWRQCILERVDFLAVYVRLLEEVVCPYLRSKISHSEPVTFYCQYPPTLRLQPGPSTDVKRLHRDAEYGHQDGEVNFWMPLSDYSKTKSTLWVESEPNADDFHPLDINIGEIAMFHGTLVRHYAPGNPSEFLRASMDFRIGVDTFFDPQWRLEGLQHSHGRREITL